MTYRLQTVAEDIEAELTPKDVAKLFAACCARLAADGQKTYDACVAEFKELDGSDQREAGAWLEDIAKIANED